MKIKVKMKYKFDTGEGVFLSRYADLIINVKYKTENQLFSRKLTCKINSYNQRTDSKCTYDEFINHCLVEMNDCTELHKDTVKKMIIKDIKTNHSENMAYANEWKLRSVIKNKNKDMNNIKFEFEWDNQNDIIK